jgi:damage-control phosphatase, subfamily II, stand-alone protein
MIQPTQPFVLLKDVSTYVAAPGDLRTDEEERLHWCNFFLQHIRTLTQLGVDAAVRRGESVDSAVRRAKSCCDEFDVFFTRFRDQPLTFDQRVTLLVLDCWRDGLLRKHGFVDAMIDLKDGENEKTLPLLKSVCDELDAITDPTKQFQTAVVGVFAGNRFDMGSKESAEQFLKGVAPSFAKTRDLITRPLLIDHLNEFTSFVLEAHPKHAVFFIDNAGSDFLLGAVPLARWFAKRGSRVVIAANERPTLNDMTVHDIRAWWPRIVGEISDLKSLDIQIVSTGTGEPLIDLSLVSEELNQAACGADLVMLEGMGRGVESNLDAEFVCRAVNLAMIKDRIIAKRLGGNVFDSVCRFR